MKFRNLPIILLSGFVACSLADENTAHSVVLIKVDDIRANASSLDKSYYVSSGQPDREVLSILQSAGFKTVIDLGGESEDRGMDEAAAVAALGMRYVTLPVAAAEDVTFDNAAALDRILADVDGPVLVHCASGNRVGALIALREKLAGATDEEALAKGKAAGMTRLQSVVVELFQQQ